MKFIFNSKLCFIEDQLTQEELIDKITPILIEQNLVNDDFAEQLKIREQEFPTGFDLEWIGVAIPHVEAKHIKKSAFWCAVMKEHCTWTNVETDEPLNVRLLFGLLMSDAGKQIDLLQWITGCFRNKEFLEQLVNSKDENQLYQMLNEELQKINI